MSISIKSKSIRLLTLATLILAILIIPGRVNTMGDPQGDPMGACCLFDGACIFLTEVQCETKGGIYQGDDVTCEEAACAPLGACCIPFDVCVVSTIQECPILGGVLWAPGQDCLSSYKCPPLGACCELDGTCRVTAEFSCDISGGAYQGDGLLCQDISCSNSCSADFDGDGMVGTVDLIFLLIDWGSACEDCFCADLDGDCAVTTADLLILLSSWGQCS